MGKSELQIFDSLRTSNDIFISDSFILQVFEQQNNNMEQTPTTFQDTKNKRRLIHQNIKLFKQVTEIKTQIEKIVEKEPVLNQTLIESQMKPVLNEIALQQKIIKKLRGQIQLFKLEKAKDNVEYIVREEDDLKIAKKLQSRLIDEKNIYLNKKADKNIFLEKQVPYQQYGHSFKEKLTEVVRHNREQAAIITQIEREIRKYHLMKKSKESSPERPVSPDKIRQINTQIEQKKEAKNSLERQWKPHFTQLDEQFSNLLHQLSLKKQELSEVQRQQKNWETRVSAIREADSVLNDKQRLEQVTVSVKLKKRLQDLIQSEEDKKKKKVNHEQLMYEFMNKKVKDREKDKKDNEEDKPVTSAPLLPGQKKKEEKIMETQHNDKNISKKIDKGPPKKTVKNSQTSNTELTIPPKGSKKVPRQDSVISQFKKGLPSEERTLRLWEQSISPEASPEKETQRSVPRVVEVSPQGTLQLKEFSIVTEVKNWEEP